MMDNIIRALNLEILLRSKLCLESLIVLENAHAISNFAFGPKCILIRDYNIEKPLLTKGV